MKRPAFQFYPGDWLRSADLRACSVGARGLWIDMLCLMHEGTPYGYLRVGGTVIHSETLARMVGAEVEQIAKWLAELAGAEVFSTDKNGVIFSRRMVRDERIRGMRASAGKIGGTHRALKQSAKQTGKQTIEQLSKQIGKHTPNQNFKQTPPPAFAVAVKTIRSTERTRDSGEDYPQDSKPNGGQAPETPTATPSGSGEKWWLTVQGIAQKGIELGIPPTYREEARDYKRRLFVEIEARRNLAQSKPEGQ
jgi:hypothetical protein